MWLKLKNNKLAVSGLMIIAILVAIAIFAPKIVSFEPTRQNIMDRLQISMVMISKAIRTSWARSLT